MSLFAYLKGLFSSEPSATSQSSLKGVAYTDAKFQNLVAARKVPGLSVTILKNGEQILQQGYGFADLEKGISIHPKKTLFRMASISKCITGLAFGKMVEEGIVHWDDSFYKHVPYFPKKKHDFTLRQLASHTAGIRGYRGKEFALNQPYSIKESMEVFKEDPLVFQPGKGYLYNSFDFVLLSLAMQEAGGIPFEDYVKEKVLNPLGMRNTLNPREISEFPLSNRSIFYTKRASGFKKAIEVDNFYKLAGGGYLSTSEDIARMGQAILERRLLKNGTYDQLLTAQTINKKSTYYGLGFQISLDHSGKAFVGHVGNSVGAYTNFFVYPKEQLIISILINCSDPKVQEELDASIHTMVEENRAI